MFPDLYHPSLRDVLLPVLEMLEVGIPILEFGFNKGSFLFANRQKLLVAKAWNVVAQAIFLLFEEIMQKIHGTGIGTRKRDPEAFLHLVHQIFLIRKTRHFKIIIELYLFCLLLLRNKVISVILLLIVPFAVSIKEFVLYGYVNY